MLSETPSGLSSLPLLHLLRLRGFPYYTVV
jgi:hypothetical protein